MGWKGTIRSINAAAARAEREQRRRQRELEQQRKQIAKMEELERARFEVEEFENYIDVLSSVHKDCGPDWDWKSINSLLRPSPPLKSTTHEQKAADDLENYKPTFFQKLFRQEEKIRQEFENKIIEAQAEDEKEFAQQIKEHEERVIEWETFNKISEGILKGDINFYTEAVKEISPFEEIDNLGTKLTFTIHSKDLAEVTLHVASEQIIPSERKSLLKSGKLSVKAMPKTQFYELYQDYICGAVLRIARELFALLPIEMVIITAMSKILDTSTGHKKDQPILSVAIPKETLHSLNIERIDPSDSLSNFVHNMKFYKTKGFAPVNKLEPKEFIT